MSPVQGCLFILLLIGAYNAHACTSGSYNDPKGYMSFRLFDLPSTYFNNLAYVPPNIRMQLLPVAGDQWSSLGRTTRVKNGFVCLSSSENILRAMMEVAAPGLRLNVDSWPGGCGDGMNTKGLHVSSLMQINSTGINRYSGSGPAIEQMDMVNFILARYDDTASVQAALASGELNPVLNPNFEIITKLLFTTMYATLHYNIRDNSGSSLVIEYSGPNNLQWWDNTGPPYNGALANNPLWTPQIEYYKEWFATYAEPDQYITIHDSKFLNLPGSYNSSHRFARAAKLPEEGYIWEWPKDIEISPRYAVDGQPETNPALMAIMGIISSVWLPKGIDDAGGRQYEGGATRRDIVWFAFIADHKLNAYYYRVANTPMWKRIVMGDIDFKKMDGCIRYMKLRGSKWWVDEANAWAHNRRDAQLYHNAPEMTMAALREDIKRLMQQN